MFEYRSAIALNNIGCALLQKNCFQQGHLCLRDAMTVMRHQHAPSPVGDDQAEKLQQARSYLANPRQNSVSLPLQVVSSSDGIGLEPSSRICSQTRSLVRIEVGEHDEMDSDLLCCIIVYNVGLSFLCLANVATFEARSKVLAGSAVRVIKLSNDILALCQDKKMQSQCVYFMAVFQLEALSEALGVCGRNEDVIECDIRLAALIAEASQLTTFDRNCVQAAAPAA